MVRHVFHSRHRVSRFVVWSLLAWGMVISAAPAWAQGSGAVIIGTIVDAQGGVLPGVALTLRNIETGTTRTALSEADGKYRVAALPPGRYDLTAELSGFSNAEVKDVTLTLGLELRRDLTMSLQGVQESLTVTGQAPVVETTRTEVSSVVTQQQIDSLPVQSRQPISLALLLPGTSTDNVQARRESANIGAGGASSAQTAYHLDGGMNWSNNSGQPHLQVPQSAVQEFKVLVSQASAEFGGNTGGVVIVATKTGTNRFNGEVFEYFRDKTLNTLDKFQSALGSAKPDFRRNQFGASLGGPLIKDRLHFFTAIERTKEHTSFTVNTGAPQFYSALEGTFPNDNVTTLSFVRGDLQITPHQSLFVRYAYHAETLGCESCGGPNAAFNMGGIVYSPRDSHVVGHTWTIGSRMLNEIRLQIPPSHLDSRGGPPGLPMWDVSRKGEFPPERFTSYTQIYNFPSLSWGANNWSLNWTDRREYRDDFSVTAGNHLWKFGGAYLSLTSPEEQPNNSGTWNFTSDQLFNPSDPVSFANLKGANQFTASFPPLNRTLENHWIQGYVQDEWRPLSNLTLDLGLRYDNQYHSFNHNLDLTLVPRLAELVGDPKTRADNNNIGPRAGVAWDVRGDGRSVVRAAYGLYYQYLMQGGLRPELTALRQTNISIRNPTYPDPYGGKEAITFASTAPPNVSITDHNIRNAKAEDVNVGFSRELRQNMAIHFDGVYTDITDMAQTANINTPLDPVTGVRPRPTWGRIIQLQAGGEHKYKALFVRLEKRYTNRYQYLVSYTLAKQDNTGAGTNPLITDFYNPGSDWGPGSADRRHAFVGSGSILLPYDISLGAVWTLRSTMPFSARAGIDLNADGSTVNGQHTDYVPGTTRNQGNRISNADLLSKVNAFRAATRDATHPNGYAPLTDSQFDTNGINRMDVRVSKSFPLSGSRKVELIAQVFNLFGHDNLISLGSSGWQENALSNSFGKIQTTQPRQQGEVALRVVF